MFKSKTATVVTLTMAICVMASQASAQTSPQALETAHPILSQSPVTIKSVETERKAMPNGMSVRKITRVLKAVPVQATATQLQQKSVYSGVINAKASEENGQTRFIYSRRKDDTHMPVYFNEESLKSK